MCVGGPGPGRGRGSAFVSSPGPARGSFSSLTPIRPDPNSVFQGLAFLTLGGNIFPLSRGWGGDGLGTGVAGLSNSIALAWPEDLRLRVDIGAAYVAGLEMASRDGAVEGEGTSADNNDNDSEKTIERSNENGNENSNSNSNGHNNGGRNTVRRRSVGVFRARNFKSGAVRARLPVTIRLPQPLIDMFQVLTRWLAVRTSAWQVDSLFASKEMLKYVFATTEAVRPVLEFYNRADPPEYHPAAVSYPSATSLFINKEWPQSFPEDIAVRGNLAAGARATRCVALFARIDVLL